MKLAALCLPLFLSFAGFSAAAENQCSPAVGNMPASCLTEQYTMSVLWYQNAAEARAAFYQGYQLGRLRLEQALNKKSVKPLAVVLDLDETVLDDSPHQAWLLKNQQFLLAGWDEWVEMAAAEPVPGALDFLRFADEHGVKIFYLSDRKQSQFDVTLSNLQRINLPQARRENLLLKTPEMHGKQSRRDALESKYNVVLYFGDNLADFIDSKGKTQEERNSMMEAHRQEFGDRFIIFPNPMYGDWYGGVIGDKFNADYNEIYKLRRSRLTSFK
ncbi:5'-nucleotidase, lipoprotein e(P4) family [Pluralibacter gergoviae]|uniref:5'-nucleotidase, lipoprotein e(P4) family n=1 Tax=Pluralibacter gergoviae TaxID=61647 RepID=UPI00290A687C|nr:5'-nucleotidase, lipoprotein e(P4) family [Pluralibacter gergoviae]MDU4001282.1 5'-nucleotidase, lipoprotein e(P4) family [Pluralibacter gergoviae]